MRNHLKAKTPCALIDDPKMICMVKKYVKNSEKRNPLQCEKCEKVFRYRSSKHSHAKVCKVDPTLTKTIQELTKQVEELKQRVAIRQLQEVPQQINEQKLQVSEKHLNNDKIQDQESQYLQYRHWNHFSDEPEQKIKDQTYRHWNHFSDE
jgi:glutamyl-tRNA reductase